MSSSTLRVFISSTSRDLRLYRKVAEQAVLEQGWFPVMMEHFGTSAESTVEFCRRQVEDCDLVLLLVAFRRGWVPKRSQGGDGRRSVTAYEREAARRRGIPVRVLLARESWPGNLWEEDQKAREWVRKFRAELNQVAEFFDAGPVQEGTEEPVPGREFGTLVRKVLLDHRDWLGRQEAAAPREPRKPVGAETVLDRLEPLTRELLLSQRDLRKLYRQSAPPGWEPLPAATTPVPLLSHCLHSLARAPRQSDSGTFPLLRFVGLLGDLVPANVAGSVRAWLEEATGQLGRDEADAAKLRASAAAPPAEEPPACPCHLLVQVEPRQCRPGAYGVKAWLLGGGTPACLRAGEEDYGREALPAVLNQLRAELAEQRVACEHVWLEFLLPRQLLGTDVDQWEVDLDFLSVPVGVEYRVVVRSLERARRPGAASAHQARWQALHRRAAAPCRLIDSPDQAGGDSGALWIEHAECDGMRLYTGLRDASGLVCVLLGRPPRPEPADPRRDVLNALLQAGIPVVVWVRHCPADDKALRTELSLLLGEQALLQLPDRVWDLRRRAVQQDDPAHVGRHVTLLWDDPTRRSPDFEQEHQLRPPGRG